MQLGPVAEFDLDALDRMHRTNIRGTFVVTQQAARRIRAGGAIVTFSTSVTRLAFPGYAPYAAVRRRSRRSPWCWPANCASRHHRERGGPGPTATRSSWTARTRRRPPRRAAPLERLGTPADIAETVAFLAGPARWVNGQVLFVNGGIA
ncbi:SDR family oxidoreductase [Streptacidiphilus sp. 4-A2]|nr:SDR family oxidoreductase [Streptacidiphilus sp. 4-A2]